MQGTRRAGVVSRTHKKVKLKVLIESLLSLFPTNHRCKNTLESSNKMINFVPQLEQKNNSYKIYSHPTRQHGPFSSQVFRKYQRRPKSTDKKSICERRKTGVKILASTWKHFLWELVGQCPVM